MPWSSPRQRPTLPVILVDGERRPEWLLTAIDRRRREEFAKLGLALNEAKSRVVDLVQRESFGFYGFDFRRVPRSEGAGGHSEPRRRRS